MAKDLIVAGLDLGTSRVKVVIAHQNQAGDVDIIGTGSHPSKGLRQGVVVNAEDAIHSIRAAVDEAEMMAGCEIREVLLAVSGRHIESFNSDGMVRIGGDQVVEADVTRVIDMAEAVRLPQDHAVLHVVPQSYIIDGQAGISRPLGMSGVRLEVRAHVVVGNLENTRVLESCVRGAGLVVRDLIHAPIAQAEAVLSSQSRDLGVVLVDIGGDTTDVAVYFDGAVVHTSALPLGGDHITHDIKDCLNTPSVEAEHLKQMYGSVGVDAIDPDEMVEVPGVGGRRPQEIERRHLCEIIQARVVEILNLVRADLLQLGFLDRLGAGVVLTGGTAQLSGLTELAEEVLGLPATIGGPKGIHGLTDLVNHPRFTTATGLVLCALHNRSSQWFSRARAGTKEGGFRRIIRALGLGRART